MNFKDQVPMFCEISFDIVNFFRHFLARLFYEKGSYPTRVGVGVSVGVTPWLSFSYHPTLFQKYYKYGFETYHTCSPS
jgi:hypothetical protein